MSLVDVFNETRQRFNGEPQLFPFPVTPKEIQVGPYKVWEYIDPGQMEKIIRNLADRITLDKYEAVLVNRRGGNFIADRIFQTKKTAIPYHEIEVHRAEGGFGVVEVEGVPPHLYGHKVITIDDILDSGGVFDYIGKKLSPDSGYVALIKKDGIKNQIHIPNCTVGVRIEGDKWIGGCGMDLGVAGEEDVFRKYPGIVVKID